MGETQLNQLQIAQDRAMRVILHCDRYTKVERMRDALQFMSIKQRLYYNVCIFIFKILRNMLPLRDRLEIIDSERETRQMGNIKIKFRKTKNAQNSMFYEGIKMYNALPIEIKNSERLESFKRILKISICYSKCLLNLLNCT